MDPLTAALNLATEVVKLILNILEHTPDDVRAAQARRAEAQLEEWLTFVKQFAPKETP